MPSDNEIKEQSAGIMTSTHSQKSQVKGQADDSLLYSPRRREIEDLIRQKIVRELHDGLTQTVSALAMRINFARRMLNSEPEAAEKELEKVENLVRETAREIRHMIFILHPMDMESQGLSLALETLVEKMEELFNLEIELIINGDLVGFLPLEDQQVIYSIVEEAIDSIRKRKRIERVMVRLNRIDQQLAQLEIEDKGKPAAREERPFQGQDLESIEKYAGLIGGSVKVENKGYLVQILFPFPSVVEENNTAPQ